MKAYQIMEEIINELNDSTINSMVRKRLKRVEDFDKKFRNSSNPLQLIDKKYQLENELNRAATARDMRKVNPKFKEFLKGELAQYRTRAKGFKEASGKKGNTETMSEALEIMEEILLEASPLEVKRRIANEFKDKIGDMYNKAVEDDKKNSEEKMNLHNKIHGKGGSTVVVMGDKIEDFSDNPEIRKDQEKFNEVTDKSKKSGEKVHKLGNLKNLVDYYKNEALELAEAIKDEIKNHQKWTDGASTFSYKGNNYSYNPKSGLKKEGQTKDDRNPIQKVVDSSNKEFEKARKYNYDTERQSRAVSKKINKEVAKLEKKEGKGAFPAKTNDTIKKLLDTASVIKANKADADKNFQEINKRQQDMAGSAKGVKHQVYDVWTSKKEDNFGWKPTVKTSEALELTEAIINEFTEADKKEAAKKVLKDRKRKYLDKHKEYKEMDSAGVADLETAYNDAVAKERYDHAKKLANEALEEALNILLEFTEADKKEAAKKVLKDRMLDFYDKYYELEDAVPTKDDMEDLKRREKRYKHAEKVANEAFSLAESITGYADNIFELDYENKQNVNTNKIRKLKKDKDGENVEVVSVADELFPYEGNAKQQFNQKVLAKINDMIEGKGSLEDLIQFVRKYSGNKKVANESTEISEAVRLLEEMINEVSKETRFEAAKSSLPKREEEFSKVSNELDDLVTKNNYEYTGDNGVAKPKGWPYGNSKTIPEVENKIKEFRKKADRRSHAKDIVSTEGEGHDALMARDTSHRSFTTHQKRKNNAAEALEEIKQVVEGLFVNDGRGDLLNDIDNALGSPVKKTVKGMVKQCTGCKQKKVK